VKKFLQATIVRIRARSANSAGRALRFGNEIIETSGAAVWERLGRIFEILAETAVLFRHGGARGVLLRAIRTRNVKPWFCLLDSGRSSGWPELAEKFEEIFRKIKGCERRSLGQPRAAVPT
jgi:hypothetical protein